MTRLDYGTIYEIVEELTGVRDTDGDDVVYSLLNEVITHMTQEEATAWIERFLKDYEYMELWAFYFGDEDERNYWESI